MSIKWVFFCITDWVKYKCKWYGLNWLNIFYSCVTVSQWGVFDELMKEMGSNSSCPAYAPVFVLQAGQGVLQLLLVLVLQVSQQHVLSAGRVLIQGWAGVTQEVLIFIPESPTQETAHWATSTRPPAAQSRASSVAEQTARRHRTRHSRAGHWWVQYFILQIKAVKVLLLIHVKRCNLICSTNLINTSLLFHGVMFQIYFIL